jgi:hypothetical protein
MGNAYNNASLLVTPNGYKASKIYSAKPTDGSGDLAFSRASTAMRRNSAGLWESVANNVPRLQYPVGGGCPSWLFEPQATNIVLYSTDFSNGNWVAFNSTTKTASAHTTNIVGVTPYDIKNLGARGSDIFFQGIPSVANRTFQIFIKAFTIGDVGKTIEIYDGTVGADITLTEDWQEFSFYNTNAGGAIALATGTTGTPATQCTISYMGVVAGNVGNSSPIITAGSAVTRLADVSNTTGLSAVIGQTEGTMYWEGKLPQDQTSSAKYLLHLYGASPTIIITTISTVINILSGAIDLSVAYTAGANAKIAICYNNNGNFRVFVNGVKTNEVNTFVGAARTSLAYGSRGGAGDIQPNTTSNLTMLYTTALSDSEAIELTTL